MKVSTIATVACVLLNLGNISFMSSTEVENMKEIRDIKISNKRRKTVKQPLDDETIGERYKEAYKAVKQQSEIIPLSQIIVKRKQKRSSAKATPWTQVKRNGSRKGPQPIKMSAVVKVGIDIHQINT